jgi:hypothetical protein
MSPFTTPWEFNFRGPHLTDKTAAVVFTLNKKIVAVIEAVDDLETEFDHHVRVMAAAQDLLNTLNLLLTEIRAISTKNDNTAYHNAMDLTSGVFSDGDRILWYPKDRFVADVMDDKGRTTCRIRGSHYARQLSGPAQFRTVVKTMVAAEHALQTLKDLVTYAKSINLGSRNRAFEAAAASLKIAEPPKFALLHEDKMIYRGTENECREVITRIQTNTVKWALAHGGWQIVEEQAGLMRAKNNRSDFAQTM